MSVRILERVVETRLERRGEGRSLNDPIRVVTQYWDEHGNFLAEFDPHTAKPPPSGGTDG